MGRELSSPLTFKRMKLRWMCRCTTGGESSGLFMAIQSAGRKRDVRLPVGTRAGRAKEFLVDFDGILQTDGYAAYDKVDGLKLVHAVCWSHSRRKFTKCSKCARATVWPRHPCYSSTTFFGIDARYAPRIWDWPRATSCASSKPSR
jgi:hypothetical protein